MNITKSKIIDHIIFPICYFFYFTALFEECATPVVTSSGFLSFPFLRRVLRAALQ